MDGKAKTGGEPRGSFSGRPGEMLPLALQKANCGVLRTAYQHSKVFWLFRKQEIREITSGEALCTSANCFKRDPHFYRTAGRQEWQDLPPAVGEMRLWRSKFQRVCSSSQPGPRPSTKPPSGQESPPREQAEKNVTAIDEASCGTE